MISFKENSDGDLEVEFRFKEEHIVVLFLLLKSAISSPSFKDLDPLQRKIILEMFSGFNNLNAVVNSKEN